MATIIDIPNKTCVVCKKPASTDKALALCTIFHETDRGYNIRNPTLERYFSFVVSDTFCANILVFCDTHQKEFDTGKLYLELKREKTEKPEKE